MTHDTELKAAVDDLTARAETWETSDYSSDRRAAISLRTILAALSLLQQREAIYNPMPVNKDGQGPAYEHETVSVLHQVWDATDNSTLCEARDETTARRIADALSRRPTPASVGATPCFECGSTERIGTACKPCNPELVSVGADWVLVPREPTDAMLAVGADQYSDMDHQWALTVYRAMIAATPSLPPRTSKP
ncbi:hypothetical protein Kuura_024 [Caulobacter phage Kuura]|nr:hypothetical protein Kuura_024 [Caulobacter phage Kuura]